MQLNLTRNFFDLLKGMIGINKTDATGPVKCALPRNMSATHKALHGVIAKAFEGVAFNGIPFRLKDGDVAYWLAESGEQADCYWWRIDNHPIAPVTGGIMNLGAGLNNLLSNNQALREYRAVMWDEPLRIQVNKLNPEALPLFQEVWNILKDGKTYPVNRMLCMLGLEHVFKATNIVAKSLLATEALTHWLIAGASGSGKTTLAGQVLLTMALLNDPAHLSLVILDPKGDDFYPSELKRLPHLACPIVLDMADAVAAIKAVEKEMLDRIKAPKTDANGRKLVRSHFIVVFIDEINTLVSYSPEIIEPLQRLAQTGRSCGIHLMIGTQRPTVDVVKGAIKANVGTRMVGLVSSKEEAFIASGRQDTGAEVLPGKGMFVACIGAREAIYRAAFVDWKNDEGGQIGLMVNDICRRWAGIESPFEIRIVQQDEVEEGDYRDVDEPAPAQTQPAKMAQTPPAKPLDPIAEDNNRMVRTLIELVRSKQVAHISLIKTSSVRRQIGPKIIGKEVGKERATMLLNMAATELGQRRDEEYIAPLEEEDPDFGEAELPMTPAMIMELASLINGSQARQNPLDDQVRQIIMKKDQGGD